MSSAAPTAGETTSAGDPLPPACELIEVRVAELRQLFNAIDPSPFRERDLDTKAEEFVVGWAREAPRNAPLGLLVHLERRAGLPEEAAILRDAITQFFAHRGDSTRRQLRQLFRIGRRSLLIGVLFLATVLVLGELVETALGRSPLGEILRESLLIGGWVAMWRPLEVFLYDWWPIRAEQRLYERLSVMPVRIAYRGEPGTEAAWRTDWPAVPPQGTKR